jgi:hypothetical protein
MAALVSIAQVRTDRLTAMRISLMLANTYSLAGDYVASESAMLAVWSDLGVVKILDEADADE